MTSWSLRNWRREPGRGERPPREENSLQVPEPADTHAMELKQLIWVGPERCLHCVAPVAFKNVLKARRKQIAQGSSGGGEGSSSISTIIDVVGEELKCSLTVCQCYLVASAPVAGRAEAHTFD